MIKLTPIKTKRIKRKMTSKSGTVDLKAYQEKRQRLLDEAAVPRTLCTTCFQSAFGCYCRFIRRFDPKIKFMILIHPIEVKRRIATGRMSHLCLERSELIAGEDYSEDLRVQRIIEDPRFHCVILYPGARSADLSRMSGEERKLIVSEGKELAVFVIDGTWATARKMVRSRNLAALPRICFSPSEPSRFKGVRRQPAPGCFSTIEAIHQTIELLGEACGFEFKGREHDGLLEVFERMVEKQTTFTPAARLPVTSPD